MSHRRRVVSSPRSSGQHSLNRTETSLDPSPSPCRRSEDSATSQASRTAYIIRMEDLRERVPAWEEQYGQTRTKKTRLANGAEFRAVGICVPISAVAASGIIRLALRMEATP